MGLAYVVMTDRHSYSNFEHVNEIHCSHWLDTQYGQGCSQGHNGRLRQHAAALLRLDMNIEQRSHDLCSY